MRALFVIAAARSSLLAAAMAALLVGCGADPKASDPKTRDPAGGVPPADGTWSRWKSYGDEASYLNTRYLEEGPPIVVELLDIWRPEPAFTYEIKDRRAFWCRENEIALLERWVSKNGGPFRKPDLPKEMWLRKSIRDYDVHSGTMAAPPNQIAILHTTVCSRRFGDRIADPMADFDRITSKRRDR